MKIRYTLIIAILAAALGYGCAPAIDAHPELIGGGIVYE